MRWYVEKSEVTEPVATAGERPAGPVLDPPLTDEEVMLVEDFVRQFRAYTAKREADGKSMEGLLTTDEELRGLALTNIQTRRTLRDRWGIDVDNAHPGAHVVYEYDPPLATCPKGCHAYFEHLDAPQDPAELERWKRNGYPGRRRCDGCGTEFEALPAPSRQPVRLRLETPEETEARLRAAADAVARDRERHAAQATPDMFGAEKGDPDGDSHSGGHQGCGAVRWDPVVLIGLPGGWAVRAL